MSRAPESRQQQYAKSSALKIAVIYAFVGGLWILLSDLVLGIFIKDREIFAELQTFKGWFFVFATALMLYVLINRDYTTMRGYEEATIESEERYHALVESSSDAILLIDTQMRIESFNGAFLCLFGLETGAVKGESIRMIHPSEESFLRFRQVADATMEKKVSARVEWELMRKDGSVFPVEETLSPIWYPDESLRGFVAVIRDCTERRRAEEELKNHRNHLEQMVKERTSDLEAAHKALLQREKLKTLGALSAEVAHEIRNPLVSIGGFATRLKKKYENVPEADIILKESERLERLLNRISNYLKPVEMQARECPVSEIIYGCMELLSPEFSQGGVTWKADIDPNLHPAYVDPGILTQVIMNLLRSAIKIMDKKRVLSVRAFEAAGGIYVDFRIPVLSPGIEDPELVLAPFEDEGRTFSMSLCSKLLRDMGGHLSFLEDGDFVTVTLGMPRSTGPSEPDRA